MRTLGPGFTSYLVEPQAATMMPLLSLSQQAVMSSQCHTGEEQAGGNAVSREHICVSTGHSASHCCRGRNGLFWAHLLKFHKKADEP